MEASVITIEDLVADDGILEVPVQLVRHVEGKLELVEETAQYLSGITCPLVVVGIAGLAGSGKSYLMSKFISNKQRGFEVGSTGEACTKGIWVCVKAKPLAFSEGQEQVLLLLDTEGLGNPLQETNFDAALLAFTILLSSYFIYNSVGSIDERAIQQLHLTLNLPKCIADSDDFRKQAPPFLWVLRDCDGAALVNTTNEREYMEAQLGVRRGIDITSQSCNFITRRITSYFRERDCVTLPPPTSPENFPNLLKMSDTELDPMFNAKLEELILNTLRKAPVKFLTKGDADGSRKFYKMNGASFITFIRDYLERMNVGVVFKRKRDDSASRETSSKPIYQRAVDNLDAQIRINVSKYDLELQEKQKTKKKSTISSPPGKSTEMVLISVDGKPVKKDKKSKKRKPKKKAKRESKEKLKTEEKATEKPETVAAGPRAYWSILMSFVRHFKYFVGVFLVVSFVVIMIIIFT